MENDLRKELILIGEAFRQSSAPPRPADDKIRGYILDMIDQLQQLASNHDEPFLAAMLAEVSRRASHEELMDDQPQV